MMRRLLIAAIALLAPTLACAQPSTTKPNAASMILLQCLANQPLLGNGAGVPGVCGTALGALATQSIPCTVAQGCTSQTTALAARGPSGLNVDSMHLTGDAIVTIAGTTRVEATSATLTASRAWTLPSAASLNSGQHIVVADIFGGINGANTIVITRAGTDTINGQTTLTMSVPFDVVDLVTDGISKWSFNRAFVGPTSQLLTAGTDATYTRPAGVVRIEGFMIGGGGGGLGSGDTSAATAPTAGGNTCFKTSGTACTTPLYQATGGAVPARAATPAAGGAGGGAAGSATCNDSTTGGGGQGGLNGNSAGGKGGDSAIGGGAPGAVGGGTSAVANTGGGGSGGGTNNTTLVAGAGGGGGGYCHFVINAPASTYVYTIGAAGAGGALGTGGLAGGAGGTGRILIKEYYQ